jgi:hypothetical protein
MKMVRLPLTDHADGRVLPEYEDDRIKERAAEGDKMAALLLRLPAGQRQNAMAEVDRLAYVKALSPSSSGTTEQWWPTGVSHLDALAAVVAVLDGSDDV